MKKDNKVIKEILSWVMVIVIALISALLINRFVIYKVSSPTESMENTILVGEKVWTYRLAYLFTDPERGDIVVFPAPDNEDEDYIKRIIGLPGETIEGKDGIVFIDGVALKENYFKEEPTGDFGPYTIPEDCYFMMGDNRNISLDARYWENKFVERDKIEGKAIFKYPDFTWFGKVEY